jgi:hypothetical protein
VKQKGQVTTSTPAGNMVRTTRGSLNRNQSQNKEGNGTPNFITSKHLSDAVAKRRSAKKNWMYALFFLWRSHCPYDHVICNVSLLNSLWQNCQCSLFQDECRVSVLGWSKSGTCKVKFLLMLFNNLCLLICALLVTIYVSEWLWALCYWAKMCPVK